MEPIEYYKVSVVCTGRSYRKDDEYSIFDHFSKTFETLIEVKKYLVKRYGQCKKQKMYRDNPNGEAYHAGWLYCFNSSDISHVPVNKWRQQDWVEVTRVNEILVLPDVAGI